jgi:exopolysaccharide biosynthesis polyprenyl glycosylphosphotransferase
MTTLKTSDDVAIARPRQPLHDVLQGAVGDVPHQIADVAMPGISSATRHRQAGLVVEMGLLAAAVTAVGWTAQASSWWVATVLAMMMVVVYRDGVAACRPRLTRVAQIFRDTAPVVAALALSLTLAGAPSAVLRQALLMVVAAVSVAVAGVLLRRLRHRRLSIMVAGDQTSIARAASAWAGSSDINVVGGFLLGDERDRGMLTESFGVPMVGQEADLSERVAAWNVDLVVVAPGADVSSRQLRSLGWELETSQAGLAVLGLVEDVAPHRIAVTRLAGNTLLEVGGSRPSAFLRAVRCVLDRVLGALLLILVSPLILAIAFAVRRDSAGPAFFRQTRVGLDGEPFTMYKFRSMHKDADKVKSLLAAANERDEVLFKMPEDPRITRVGKLLRRTSLDELPQLLNVVRGEMSLVGPRPALPDEVAQYDGTARRRLCVRPGMTGLAQVSGRADLPYETSVRLDLHQVDNRSLTDDVVILARTVDAVARRRGAY